MFTFVKFLCSRECPYSWVKMWHHVRNKQQTCPQKVFPISLMTFTCINFLCVCKRYLAITLKFGGDQSCINQLQLQFWSCVNCKKCNWLTHQKLIRKRKIKEKTIIWNFYQIPQRFWIALYLALNFGDFALFSMGAWISMKHPSMIHHEVWK